MTRFALLALLSVSIPGRAAVAAAGAERAPLVVHLSAQPGDFPLVRGDATASIVAADGDYKVVHIAAGDPG